VTPVTGKGLTYRHSVLLLAGVLLLWALGCTFFWCLVAVNPGEGEASSLTLWGSTIHKVGALAEDARGEQASCMPRDKYASQPASVIRNWKRFAEAGATAAVQASEDGVPASHLREAYAKIRELERALGRKTMEVEILRAAQEVAKKGPSLRKESGR
jgi:hypothetical protein